MKKKPKWRFLWRAARSTLIVIESLDRAVEIARAGGAVAPNPFLFTTPSPVFKGLIDQYVPPPDDEEPIDEDAW